MAKFDIKTTLLTITLGAFLTLAPKPAITQTYPMRAFPDPEVLVSRSASPADRSGQDLASALVDIKAVDDQTLLTQNGKTGIGSEIRNGQGIIIDPAGIIATNRHIIANARHIYVMLAGGKIFEASVLLNSQADLCLIKIDTPHALSAVLLADPSKIRTGIHVTAIPNAEYNSQELLNGQVIKVFKGTGSGTAELLETNIRLNPGDSGGPILNQDGFLIGLIMGKQISDPGKSYAIASSRILQEYTKYRNSLLN